MSISFNDRPALAAAFKDKATGAFYLSQRSIPPTVVKNGFVVPLYEGERLPHRLPPTGWESWYDVAMDERTQRVRMEEELVAARRALKSLNWEVEMLYKTQDTLAKGYYPSRD